MNYDESLLSELNKLRDELREGTSQCSDCRMSSTNQKPGLWSFREMQRPLEKMARPLPIG